MGNAPMPGPEDRNRVEQELLRELDECRMAYESAKERRGNLSGYYRDLGLDHADGRAAFRQAAIAQDAATQRYVRALKALTDFMLGKPLR